MILFADAATLQQGRARGQGQGGAEMALYLHWAGECETDVLDPYYGGSEDFAATWQQVGDRRARHSGAFAPPPLNA